MERIVFEAKFGESFVGFMSEASTAENANEALAFEVIQACWRADCREFVLCAGSRNSPLVLLLLSLEKKHKELKVWHFFEERSAAFFALGRSKVSAVPTAVVTTSGTAAAELLPAVIEAHYSGVPLFLLTADRPRHFRESGAPQAINQENLFGSYVDVFLDLDEDCLAEIEVLEASNLAARADLRWHINVCFDEPLVSDSQAGDFCLPGICDEVNGGNGIGGDGLALRFGREAEVETFLSDKEGLVVLLGNLHGRERTPELQQFLWQVGRPIWAEASSALRESVLLAPLMIRCADLYFSENRPTRVLRIGGVPSLRFWRDLEADDDIDVLAIAAPGAYPGLSRGALMLDGELHLALRHLPLDESTSCRRRKETKEALLQDGQRYEVLQDLLEKYPLCEAAWVKRLSEQIPSGSQVFLGNSMPIRQWNLAASREHRSLSCFASRGANGIDGQVSTFLGMAADGRAQESWGLFGDLTTMYDLSAPWVMDQLNSGKRRLVVMNNGGGRIFSRLPHLACLPDEKKRVTENRHGLGFQHWAAMWGMDYKKVSELDEFSVSNFAEEDSVVIELCPDSEQTEGFWVDYARIIPSEKR